MEALNIILSDEKIQKQFPLVLGSQTFAYRQTGAN